MDTENILEDSEVDLKKNIYHNCDNKILIDKKKNWLIKNWQHNFDGWFTEKNTVLYIFIYIYVNNF